MVFLIIFGTRGVTTSAGRGEFYCPSCDRKRPYEHKRVRRFFTLYFIPLIPLDTLGEYVECQHCRGTFKPAVLSFDPEAAEKRVEAEFRAAVKRVMVMMMLADGEIADDEVETIRKVYGKVASTELSKEDIDREVAAARSDTRSLKQYVASMIGSLNDAGKEVVVKAAFFVAAADGKITDEETTLLAELAAALEMSPSHFKGIVDDLLAA